MPRKLKRIKAKAAILSRTSEYAEKKSKLCIESDSIPKEEYAERGVFRGLRDLNGNGVVTGLTNISTIKAKKEVDGVMEPCDGELRYRGYLVTELIESLGMDTLGFERIAYLLLMGELPSDEEEAEFKQILSDVRTLPTNFTRDVIMKAPSGDIMNMMTRSILTLMSYDRNPLDISVENSLNQCIQLISEFPLLATYAYHAHNHYNLDQSMYIHHPDPELGTAENFLRLMRDDCKFTPLEAKVLDTLLILHMEHGGGNNSTFTTRVVTSSGSDTYSTIAAAMSSLKGPKHGGANIKVMEMMDDIKEHVKDFHDQDEVKRYLEKIVDKEAFDQKGLIYGMGHAVYSVSDPRERAIKGYVSKLAEAKGRSDDMALYQNIELLAPEVIAEKRRIYKGVSPNVDFYSGFVYEMLDIPRELYTALFAIARIVGWSAHRIEELVCMDKIIRPAYVSVSEDRELT